MSCPGGVDMNGCTHPEMCQDTTVCGFDEMTCPGAYDGCVENVNCVSKSVWGFDGQECERESCDPECLPDEHLCDMGYNFDTGCPNPMECRSGTGWDMATESEFPCASVCPTVCGPNQMSCDTTDENGCLVPGPCVDNFWDSPMGDSTCTGFCPMDCGMDMMHCPGGFDEYGCEMPGTCMMMEDGCPSEYM